MLPVGLLRQFGSLATSITIATRRRSDSSTPTSSPSHLHAQLWAQLGNPKWRIAVNDADFEILPTRNESRAHCKIQINEASVAAFFFLTCFFGRHHQRPHSSLGKQLKATLLQGVSSERGKYRGVGVEDRQRADRYLFFFFSF